MRTQMKRLLFLLLFSSLQCFASRNLTDELGRSVVVPDHPHRLVCLAPSVVDGVYSLGAGGDVIAVSEHTTYPAEAAEKPKIGAPLNPSLETIVALHPDLVLGNGRYESCARSGSVAALWHPRLHGQSSRNRGHIQIGCEPRPGTESTK